MTLQSRAREQVVQTRDGAAQVRVLTAGEGPSLVYLHGVGGLEWGDLLEGLARDHTVRAIEHVGSGESTGLDTFYDMWDLVTHYEELFDELELDDVILVGHSFGGMAAAEVAAHLRHRIRKLVLLAPLGLWNDAYPVAEIDAIERTRRAEVLLADPSRPLPRLVSPDVSDQEALFHADLNAASINQFTWPIPDKGLSRRLYRVTAPTLLVWGQEDRIVNPVYAEFFAAAIASTSTAVLPGLGHLLQYEGPDQVLATIREFAN